MSAGFWRGFLALDRLLQRVPSIVEIWFLEFLAVISLALGLARVGDGLGIGGCPPAPGVIDGTTLGTVAFGLVLGFIALRRILRPPSSA